MSLSKNIPAILQQYEFAMAIGNHLDYNRNCDQFLKLLMARKSLSNCWVLKKDSNNPDIYHMRYSFPTYQHKIIPKNKILVNCFRKDVAKFTIDPKTNDIIPKHLEKGAVLFFNLKDNGGLFLHGYEKKEFTDIEIAQLAPIIEKFSVSLTACDSYSKRNNLLTKLESQNKELQDYAQAVSHDLKSPLRNINTLIHWIQEDADKLDETVVSNLNLINKNMEKMDALINGILEYSLVDKKQILSGPVKLQKVIREIINVSHTPENITFKINDNLPVIQGDKFRLQQLFQNLINNSIKGIGKKEGTITIDFKERIDHWEFQVKDNGEGIEERYFKKIFQIFQSISNDNGSTGIGLSIVKKIVEFYDGEIWLTSKVGVGTTFYFTLKK